LQLAGALAAPHATPGVELRRFRSTLAAAIAVAAVGPALGCTTEPLTLGTASVGGQVFRTSGVGWGNVSLEVLCAMSPDTTRLMTAADGGFLIGFQFPGSLRGAHTASTTCRFAAPSLRAPAAVVTDTITVYPPNLQPLQLVTLREGQL